MREAFRKSALTLPSPARGRGERLCIRDDMNKLTHADLWKLEDYARERAAFRTRVIAHKKNRTVRLGAHLTLIFEDRTTVQYQVQEMLRIERIFEADAIAEELGAYNPLIPDGSNLKATMLIEYDDVDERRRELEQLRGIEDMIAMRSRRRARRARRSPTRISIAATRQRPQRSISCVSSSRRR